MQEAHGKLEKAQHTIAKLRARVAAMKNAADGQPAGSSGGADRSGRSHTPHRGHKEVPRSASPPRPQVDGDYRKGGVSWGRSAGASFGTASTGRTRAVGKQADRATKDADTEPVEPTPPKQRQQRARSARGSSRRGRSVSPDPHDRSAAAAGAASSSPASAIALRRSVSY